MTRGILRGRWSNQGVRGTKLHSVLGLAIEDYCNNDSQEFFLGHKQIGHMIGSSPEKHVYTEGTDTSNKTGVYYKCDDMCE